jgi:hypothetical protein
MSRKRSQQKKNPHLDQIGFPTLLNSLGTRRLPPAYPGGSQRRSPNIPAKKEKEKKEKKTLILIYAMPHMSAHHNLVLLLYLIRKIPGTPPLLRTPWEKSHISEEKRKKVRAVGRPLTVKA